MPQVIDCTGQRYGRLMVLSRESNSPAGAIRWKCRCDCGSETIVLSGKLASGRTKSCGCYIKDFHTKHGQYRSGEYSCWENMMQRCYNPKSRMFYRYGGRGILVDEHWHDFQCFLSDMGIRPSSKHSIDRRDNNLGYSKDNCRWATAMEQARNKSSVYVITLAHQSSPVCLKDACRLLNISYHTIRKRLTLGWSLKTALEKPLR